MITSIDLSAAMLLEHCGEAAGFLPHQIDSSLPFVLDSTLQVPGHGLTPEVKLEPTPVRSGTGNAHSPVVLSDAGGTNGLDQLIESFTSTGLLQRPLDEDEFEIVAQQIQLQMQQTQLQMLQLALRQQQLQAAQMQLKLQQQSIIVHRRQHPTSQSMTSPDIVVASRSECCTAERRQSEVETKMAVQSEHSLQSRNTPQHSPSLIHGSELQTPPQQIQRSPSASLEEIERFAKVFKRRRIALGFTQCDVGMTMGKLYGNDFSQTTISRFEALNLSFKNMCKLKPLLEKWLDDVGQRNSSSTAATAAAAACQLHHQLQQQHQQHQQLDHQHHHQHLHHSQRQQEDQSCQRAAIGNATSLMVNNDGLMRMMHCSDTVSMIADSLQTARRRKKRTNIDQTVRHALENFFRCAPKPTAEQIGEVAERLGMDRDVVQVWFCNRRQKEKRVHPGGSIGLNRSHSDHLQHHSRAIDYGGGL